MPQPVEPLVQFIPFPPPAMLPYTLPLLSKVSGPDADKNGVLPLKAYSCCSAQVPSARGVSSKKVPETGYPPNAVAPKRFPELSAVRPVQGLVPVTPPPAPKLYTTFSLHFPFGVGVSWKITPQVLVMSL